MLLLAICIVILIIVTEFVFSVASFIQMAIIWQPVLMIVVSDYGTLLMDNVVDYTQDIRYYSDRT